MRLSKKFVRENTSLENVDFHEYADRMLKLGNEYESITKLVTATNLITGEVISCEKHPESDHLNLCKVDIGSEVLNIICGAPNVRVGLKVIVAKNGAILPGGEIKKTTNTSERDGTIISQSRTKGSEVTKGADLKIVIAEKQGDDLAPNEDIID